MRKEGRIMNEIKSRLTPNETLLFKHDDDYYSEETSHGRYASLRRSYLREHRHITYNAMVISGTLEEHLTEVQREAQKRYDTLMLQMLEKDPPPSKDTDQLGWVGHLNNKRACAEEVIFNELIYV